MYKNTNQFASNLKHLRTKIGLSQRQLGVILNIDKRRLSDWEQGNNKPAYRYTKRELANFFLVTEEELFSKKLNQATGIEP